MEDLLQHQEAANELLSGKKAGLFLDIDGTLAPINPDPAAVTITSAMRQTLDRLARAIDVVVVSGRSIADARSIIGLDALTYAGNHGVEWWHRGHHSMLPEAEPYIHGVHTVAQLAARRLSSIDGIAIEDKGPSFSVHYRGALDQEAARAAILSFLDGVPEVDAFDRREGKMVIELRPPVGADKGTTLLSVVEERELEAVLAIGDDYTDLDSFLAVEWLRANRGVPGMTAAVLASGTPPMLLEAADYTLSDPEAVEELLVWLAARLAG